MSTEYPKCPKCGSDKVAAIQFGNPSPEMIEEAERGHIVLGGCCIEEDDPEWHCKDCEHEW